MRTRINYINATPRRIFHAGNLSSFEVLHCVLALPSPSAAEHGECEGVKNQNILTMLLWDHSLHGLGWG